MVIEYYTWIDFILDSNFSLPQSLHIAIAFYISFRVHLYIYLRSFKYFNTLYFKIILPI